MTKKNNNLLSIGEISKLTGAGIKSLRYYERINILKPAYTDPNSSYRYYSIDQVYLIEFILLCIDLGIPLKELTKFAGSDNMMDYRAFLTRGKETAREKLRNIAKGLQLITEMERQMDLADMHQVGEIYSREMPEKVFYAYPHAQSTIDIDPLDIVRSFFMMPYDDVDFSELPQYGFLNEYSPSGVQYYTFLELPKHMATQNENIKIIPAGTYYCRQSEDYQIDQAPEIFKDYLAGRETFLAIQIDIFVGKYKINNPIKELRVMGR